MPSTLPRRPRRQRELGMGSVTQEWRLNSQYFQSQAQEAVPTRDRYRSRKRTAPSSLCKEIQTCRVRRSTTTHPPGAQPESDLVANETPLQSGHDPRTLISTLEHHSIDGQ